MPFFGRLAPLIYAELVPLIYAELVPLIYAEVFLPPSPMGGLRGVILRRFIPSNYCRTS